MEPSGLQETKKVKRGEGETSQKLEKVPKTVRSQPIVIPEEILEMIFSHLSDPKDLMAVSNASSQFNRILKPTQTSWVFCKVFPLIYSELDKKDILNCRLVCKEWNKSVDNFLQGHPFERPRAIYPCQSNGDDDSFGSNYPPHRPDYQPYLISKEFATVFRDTLAIQKFMEEMKAHPGNPLALRDVCFDDGISEGESYWIEAILFLCKFGQHIWHVSLGPSLNRDQRYHVAHNYTILERALSLMPNLRTLVVSGFQEDTFELATDPRKVFWISNYIRRNPLPELPHLHTLLEITPDGQNPVVTELMQKYSRQLKKLVTRPYVWLKNPPEFDILPLPQVTDMDLNINACILVWQDICSSLIAPNLVKLRLIIWEDWDIASLLQPLKNAFPSLVYLGLAFRVRCKNFRSTDPPEFTLDRIKTVEIEDHPHVQYDQLFSHLPYLEYVLVCQSQYTSSLMMAEGDVQVVRELEGEDEDDEDLEIRKLMLSGSIYRSDIWSRQPFLKEFTVARMGAGWDTEHEIVNKQQYTREVYNHRFGQQVEWSR